MTGHMHLDEVVLIGRTFDEYYQIFALDTIDPAREVILDAASGVSSFCAEAKGRGYDVTASDQIYDFDADAIKRKCKADLDNVIGQLPAIADLYIWDEYPTPQALAQQRERAYTAFVQDYRVHRQRYVTTTYPETVFADGQFTLALVSHLLFLYEDMLDYAFHTATLAELLRITSGEVRIFPLVNFKGQRSVFVEQLMHDANFRDCNFQIVPVNYEFIKNGNQMLVVRHG